MGRRGEQRPSQFLRELLPELIGGDDADAELPTLGDECREVVLRKVLYLVAQQGEGAAGSLGQGLPRQRRKLELCEQQVAEGVRVFSESPFGQADDKPLLLAHDA